MTTAPEPNTSHPAHPAHPEHHFRFHLPHLHLGSAFGDDWLALKAEAFARFFGTPIFLMRADAHRRGLDHAERRRRRQVRPVSLHPAQPRVQPPGGVRRAADPARADAAGRPRQGPRRRRRAAPGSPRGRRRAAAGPRRGADRPVARPRRAEHAADRARQGAEPPHRGAHRRAARQALQGPRGRLGLGDDGVRNDEDPARAGVAHVGIARGVGGHAVAALSRRDLGAQRESSRRRAPPRSRASRSCRPRGRGGRGSGCSRRGRSRRPVPTLPSTRPDFASRDTPLPSAQPTKRKLRSSSSAMPREPSQPFCQRRERPAVLHVDGAGPSLPEVRVGPAARVVDHERLRTARDVEERVVNGFGRIALEAKDLDPILVGLVTQTSPVRSTYRT